MMQVRKEYGEPFIDVVRGFAEMGYSRQATAEVLDFSVTYFKRLVVRFDLGRYFLPQSQMRAECRGGTQPGMPGKGWPKGKPRGRNQWTGKYSDDDLLAQVRKTPSYSLARCMSEINVCTIQNRFGSWTRARELAQVGAK